MARSRNIKPALFDNELLGEADPTTVLAFIGLWTLADKEGRLEDRPKRIRAQLFPYRLDVDLCMILDWLKHESFISRYSINGKNYIQILNWSKHQSPHHKEVDSEIPPEPFDKNGDCEEENSDANQHYTHAQAMHESCMDQACPKKSTSTPLIPDSLNLIPDSLNTDSGASSEHECSAGDPPEKKAAMTKGDHERVIELYHKHLPELPQVLTSRWHGSANAKQLSARWREDPTFRSDEFWEAFFATVATNDWWMGRRKGGDGEPWKGCKLSWLVKRANFDKVLEFGQ